MILEVSGVRFRYNGTDVLKDVSMKLRPGRITGIVGPNGSGKTTLLKCMNRILRPYKGEVSIGGKEVRTMSGNELAREVAYVPQMGGKTFPQTVFDTILLGRRPHFKWGPSERDRNKVAEVIRALDLEDISMRDIGALSGGQRQKVLIARALAQEADVLLLDEPTANLDLKHQIEVMELVRAQTDDGLTAVMSIHDLNLASRFCKDIIILREGKIFAAGGKEVLSPGNIRKVYGVKVRVLKEDDIEVFVPV